MKHKTTSPSKLRELLLLEHNVERTPESITMFLKRNPKLLEECQKKIGVEDAQHETIRYDYEYWIDKELRSQIPIVQDYINTLLGRKVSKKVIKREVGRLRHICKGTKARGKKNGKGKQDINIQIIYWKIHPLALDEKKGLQYIAEIIRKGFDDFPVRLTIRNFLKYGKGEVPRKISGEKPQAKYAHINASKEKCELILDYIRRHYDLGYRFCMFLKKTATRKESSHTAKYSERIRNERIIVVWDKGKKGKKYMWKKHVDDELLCVLEPLLEEHKLFEDINIKLTMRLCREAYDKFIPDIAKECSIRPLHFWRHIFAQHMLRATGWNYSLVAMLGGWKKEETLRENYGMPPDEVIKQWGMKYVPII